MFILGLVGSVGTFPHSPQARNLVPTELEPGIPPVERKERSRLGQSCAKGSRCFQVLDTKTETKASVWEDTVPSSSFLVLFSFRD